MSRVPMLLVFCLVVGWAACGDDDQGTEACGNGELDPGEQCDGPELGGATCESLGRGYTGGDLRCTAECEYDEMYCEGGSNCNLDDPQCEECGESFDYQCGTITICGIDLDYGNCPNGYDCLDNLCMASPNLTCNGIACDTGEHCSNGVCLLDVPGETYFIAPDGDDSNLGTFEEPFRTWQKAFDVCVPGDITYFRGGVYYKQPGEPADIIPRDGIGASGTENAPIRYFNYPGEKPILDCSLINPEPPPAGQNGYNTGLYVDTANYLHFKGLTIRNVRQLHDNVRSEGLVSTDSNFQTYENMSIHNVAGRCVSYAPYYGPNSSAFINCDVFNCVDAYVTGGFVGGWGDGFNAGVEADSYLYFHGVRVWNCSDDGINLWGPGLIEVDHCWSFRNGILDGDGCGFKMNAPEVSDTNFELTRIFTNSVAAFNGGNTGAGFTENNNGGPTVTLQMYNNTSYRNLTGFTTIGNNVGPQRENVYRNNIAYDNMQFDDEESQGAVFVVNDHNSWNAELGVTVTDGDFVSLDGSQLTQPRNPDGSLPDIDFLRLAPSSDLIDVGVDVGLPYSGAAPDLGACEFVQ